MTKKKTEPTPSNPQKRNPFRKQIKGIKNVRKLRTLRRKSAERNN